MSLGLIVQDDVLGVPDWYRDEALRDRDEYKDVTIGADTFRGILPVYGDDDQFQNWIRSQGPFKPIISFFRRSPEGQPEPNYIHSDREMGDWTAILYLNPEPADGDGTIFWDAKDVDLSGDIRGAERFRVRAQFNRAVIFPSHWWHSRALFDNYGHGDSARLIQVAFGKVAA